MYLYHYAAEPHEILLTKEEQASQSGAAFTHTVVLEGEAAARFRFERKRYSQSISCMFDRLPLDLIADADFDENHVVYRKGQKIYEHRIKIDDLELDYWQTCETPIDSFMADYLWVSNDVYKRAYFALKSFVKYATWNRGTSTKRLRRLAQKYQGSYRHYFMKWFGHTRFAEQRHMYAANVPHVFIYPKNGTVVPESIEERIVT